MWQREVIAAAGVAAGILVLFVLGEVLLRVLRMRSEHTRKVVHVGAGLIVVAFPLLFSSHITVGLLALGFTAILVVSKATGQLSSVHAVPRKSRGAFYYPLAVYSTFLFADGDLLMYAVPILLLAICDALAEVVGTRFGSIRYELLGQWRSLQGSLAFFAAAMLIVSGALIVHGQIADLERILLIALVVASGATMTEAISIGGSDNIAIPFASWLLLSLALVAPPETLRLWLTVGLLCGAICAAGWVRRGVTASGAIAGALLAFAAVIAGGVAWVLPVVALYLGLFPVVRRAGGPALGLERILPGTVTSLAILVFQMLRGDGALFYPFVASLAVNLALAWSAAGVRNGTARRRLMTAGGIIGAALPVLPLLAWAGGLPEPRVIELGLIVSAGLLGALCYHALRRAMPTRAAVHFTSVAVATAACWTVLA